MLASHTTHDAPERTEARRPDASSQLQTTHDAEAAAQASKAFLLGFRSSEAPAELGLPRAEPLPSCEAMDELRQLTDPDHEPGDDPEAWHLPPPGIHTTGTQLRRRLVTPESIAELQEVPRPTLLQRLLRRG